MAIQTGTLIHYLEYIHCFSLAILNRPDINLNFQTSTVSLEVTVDAHLLSCTCPTNDQPQRLVVTRQTSSSFLAILFLCPTLPSI